MHLYIGNIVHTPKYGQLEILPDHVLGVNSRGIIEFLVPGAQFSEQGIQVVSITKISPSQFLVPGFIDTHAHAPQYPNCGIFGSTTLLDWLNIYTFPLESKYSTLSFANEVYTKVVDRQVANGTTLTSYFGTIHVESTLELAKICYSKGVRANVGRVCMERFCPDFLQDGKLDSDIKFCDLVHELDPEGKQIKAVVTPRFAPSCEFETMKKLGDLAKERQLPVQTHISENNNEIKWVAELFPDHSSYANVYDDAGLLKHDTVLAHAIHLTSDEVDLVKKRKSGISHCPNSNASIASGIAPVKRLLDRGIKVSLGTDFSGGSTVSILKNARLALLMSRLLSERNDHNPEDILGVGDAVFLATLGGAQVLALDKEIGSFEVGKKFDAQLVDLSSKDSPVDIFEQAMPLEATERVENLLHKWVYAGDDRNTTKVWVNGIQVYERA